MRHGGNGQKVQRFLRCGRRLFATLALKRAAGRGRKSPTWCLSIVGRGLKQGSFYRLFYVNLLRVTHVNVVSRVANAN